MALHATDRRSVLLAAGATVSTLLAGCSEITSRLSGDGSEGNGLDRDRARAVIDDYFDAAAAGDTDALAEVVHPASPLHPDRREGSEGELQGDSAVESPEYEIEEVTADASLADVRELESADFWFDEGELDEAIGSADVAIADATVDGPETDEQVVWVLATEDDEWRLFLAATVDDAPENPESAFEEPIHDEDEDVVASVDWDFEQEDAGDGDFGQDLDWARVELTESPGIDADTVRIESTIADYELEFYGEDAGEGSSSWAGSWAAVGLDPEGDQIVVTAIDDGEETVVHRVHYEP